MREVPRSIRGSGHLPFLRRAKFFFDRPPGVEFGPGRPGSSGKPAKPTLLYPVTARRPDRTRSTSRDSFPPSPTTRPTGTSPGRAFPDRRAAPSLFAKSSTFPTWHFLPRSSLQGRLPLSAAPRASPVPRDWAFRAAPSGAPALPDAPNGGVNKSSQGSG
ncbi:hypothetical protein BDV19DRAFT_84485 [Aspergillus venezuelensis]